MNISTILLLLIAVSSAKGASYSDPETRIVSRQVLDEIIAQVAEKRDVLVRMKKPSLTPIEDAEIRLIQMSTSLILLIISIIIIILSNR